MMKRIFEALVVVLALAAVWLAYDFFAAKGEKRDFFECGPNNELVVCPVGETPNDPPHTDCRAVGDGVTTQAAGNCS